jgi:hypothetical protein
MLPVTHEYAIEHAREIYNYYYSHAIKEFDESTSAKLAQIPADYVYNSLMSQKDCYIDNKCCLEYCNEMLDYQFNKLDPYIKRLVYEKAFNIKSNIPDIEIHALLKRKRNLKFKELYYNKFNELKENRENDFNTIFKNMKLTPNTTPTLDTIFKTLNLN